jgi:hypothetical protein
MFQPDYQRRITEERNSDLVREAEMHRVFAEKRDIHSGLLVSVRSRSAAMLIALGRRLMPNDAEIAVTEA